MAIGIRMDGGGGVSRSPTMSCNNANSIVHGIYTAPPPKSCQKINLSQKGDALFSGHNYVFAAR